MKKFLSINLSLACFLCLGSCSEQVEQIPELPQAEVEQGSEAPEVPELPQAEVGQDSEAPEVPELPQAELEQDSEIPEVPELPQAELEQDSEAPEVPELPQAELEQEPAEPSGNEGEILWAEEDFQAVSGTEGSQGTQTDVLVEQWNPEILWQGESLYGIMYVSDYENPEGYLSQYVGDFSEISVYDYGGDDWYLLISRYLEADLEIYEYLFGEDDLEQGELLATVTEPYFLLHCNVSDLFPNVLLQSSYEGETVSFSPYLSLKDGHIGENPYLLDLTEYG